MVSVRFGFGLGSLRIQFRFASDLISVRFGFGFGSLRMWFGFASDSVSVRFGFGFATSGLTLVVLNRRNHLQTRSNFRLGWPRPSSLLWPSLSSKNKISAQVFSLDLTCNDADWSTAQPRMLDEESAAFAAAEIASNIQTVRQDLLSKAAEHAKNLAKVSEVTGTLTAMIGLWRSTQGGETRASVADATISLLVDTSIPVRLSNLLKQASQGLPPYEVAASK